MAGLKDGFTYFRDLSNVPSTSEIVPGHKALFTLNDGVFVIDSAGNQVRLDDYQLIHDVSGALSASISAHSAVVYRGSFDLDTNNFVYTVPHATVVIENTSPLVTLTSPSNTSVLYVTAIRNRTTNSFDVVLSDVPNDPGYSINWLIIGEAVLSGGGGGGGSFSGSASPDLLGTGTRFISAQQSIIPTVSGAFDLGSVNRPWRDIHLSGNTMYMNGVPIHLEGNRLKVDDLYVATTDSPDASAADLSLYATIDTVASNTSMLLGMIGTKASTTSVQTTAGNLIVLTASSSANALTHANANTAAQLAGFSTLAATAAASANALAQADANRESADALLTPLTTTAALTGSLVALTAAASANAVAQSNLTNYALVTSVQTTAGNLQGQITNLNTGVGYLASVTGGFALTTSLQTSAGNLQAQIAADRANMGYLASVTGGFALTTSVQTTAGNLTAQIALRALDSAVVHNTGDESIAGNKSFTNTVTINGNLVVNGATTSVTSQNLLVADNMIEVNVGGTKPIAAGHAGMQVNRGPIAGDAYRFVFEEARAGFTVGLSGDTQLVATRQDSPVVAGLAYWNPTTFRFETATGLTSGSIASVASIQTTAGNLQAQITADKVAIGYLASVTGGFALTSALASYTTLAATQALSGKLVLKSGDTMTGTLAVPKLITTATRDLLRQSNFGYSSSYATTIIGSSGTNYAADTTTLCFNVDPLGNTNGAFSGTGAEYMFRNVGSFITPNSVNNGYNTVLSWSSAGVPSLAAGAQVGANVIYHAGNFTPGNYVAKTGAEYVAGAKTFTDSIAVSSASLITSIYPANITFTRPSAISYIDVNGVGGGFRIRTSNASGLDTVAVDIASNGNTTFGGGVSVGGLAYAAGYGAIQCPVGTALAQGISWAQDTFLYRTGAGALKTDGTLTVASSFAPLGQTLMGATAGKRIEFTPTSGLVEFYDRGASAYFAGRYIASSHSFEGGAIVIGTDPGGSDLLRVGGRITSLADHRISNTAGQVARLFLMGNGTANGLMLECSSNSDCYLWNYENRPLYIGTNNATRITVEAGGSVVIGTDPGGSGLIRTSGLLNVTNYISGDNAAYIRNTHAAGYGPVFRGGGGSAALYNALFQRYDGVELMRVAGDGVLSVNIAGGVGVYYDIAGATGRYGVGFFSPGSRATTSLACNSAYGQASVSLGGWDGTTYVDYLRTGPASNGNVIATYGIESAGLKTAYAGQMYWSASSFLGSDSVTSYSDTSAFLKVANNQSGGYDSGIALYQTTGTDGSQKKLTGTIGVVGTNNWQDSLLANQTSDMYITSRNTAGAQVERIRFVSNGTVGIYGGTLQVGPNAYTPTIGDLGVSRNTTDGAIYFGGSSLRYLYYNSNNISFRTPATGTMDWNGNIIAFDSTIKNNGRVTYTVQTGSFSDPGGSDGDIVYVV
jgi:hypothetical protein